MVLFIMLYKVVVPCVSIVEILNVTIQMKATQQYCGAVNYTLQGGFSTLSLWIV